VGALRLGDVRVSLHIGTQIVDCVESAALSAEKVQISLPEGVLALGAPRAGRKAEPWWIEWSMSIATHRSISAGRPFRGPSSHAALTLDEKGRSDLGALQRALAHSSMMPYGP
jgi:hypothetical protein